MESMEKEIGGMSVNEEGSLESTLTDKEMLQEELDSIEMELVALEEQQKLNEKRAVELKERKVEVVAALGTSELA